MTQGFVYILTNPAFQKDWIKIGKTSKQDVQERVNQLDCTSTPLPFNIYATVKTKHFNELEKLIHNTIDNFSDNRIRPNREFFNIKPENVLNFIRDISDKYDDFEIKIYDKESDLADDVDQLPADANYISKLNNIKDQITKNFTSTDKGEKWFSPMIYKYHHINVSRRSFMTDPITNESCELVLDIVPLNKKKNYIELFITKKPCGGINLNIDHEKLLPIFPSNFGFDLTTNKQFGKRRHSICISLADEKNDTIVNMTLKLLNYIEDNISSITTTALKQYN